MSTASDVLTQLEEDLKDKLHSSYGDNYTTDYTNVKYHCKTLKSKDFSAFPSLGFKAPYEETTQFSHGTARICDLYVYLYGYVPSDGLLDTNPDTDPAKVAARELEYFLLNDFTYAENVFIDNVGYGYVDDKLLSFDMVVRINYLNE